MPDFIPALVLSEVSRKCRQTSIDSLLHYLPRRTRNKLLDADITDWMLRSPYVLYMAATFQVRKVVAQVYEPSLDVAQGSRPNIVRATAQVLGDYACCQLFISIATPEKIT